MIYKTIPDCSKYEISNLGQVRNIETQRILKAHPDKDGYFKVRICSNYGILVNRFVHRLLAICFIPNPNKKPQVNHKNGIKTDNRLENLEWASLIENRRHAFATGLQKGRPGIEHHNNKLTEKDILEIRELHKLGITRKALALKFNIAPQSVTNIVNKSRWKHV